MTFNPGDILYRKYSYKNDLYCVIVVKDGPFNIGQNVKFVKMLSYVASTKPNSFVHSEISTSVEEWYVKVDLNTYDIKDKFIKKIKEFLKNNLGKMIHHDTILDNLLYIEILVALKKYEISDIVEEE
jgi:hypothetical protein